MSTNNLNPSNALFSKTRQRVLGLLYTQPNRDFYTNEIIRFANTGTRSVQKELQQLSIVGLILARSAGNQKRYQANQASPLFKALQDITLKTFGLADILRESFSPLSEKILIAFVYGSIAKQNDTLNSDIDVMIISHDLTYVDCFNNIMEAESKLERKISTIFCTPEQWCQKIKNKSNFFISIAKQPKIFLFGNEDELEKLR